MHPLAYGLIDPTQPTGIPPPKVNGGLYTGEPFAPNAAWGNVPVTPDANYMVGTNLNSANPPPGAEKHAPGYTRLGNNTQPVLGGRLVDPVRFPTLYCRGP